MTTIKPFSMYSVGALDATSRPLLLGHVLRTSYETQRGRYLEGPSDFQSPLGKAHYTGFGADGWYYTNGVQERLWFQGESIDDFTDLVTDTERWEAVGTDLFEGGINVGVHPPFGLRLFATFAGAGFQVNGRKGKMIYTSTGVDKAGISGRLTTKGIQDGTGVENSILLGLQRQGVDGDFVFIGYANTSTYPFSLVVGGYVAGVPTITGSLALPANTEEITVSIVVDELASTYEGFYSYAGNDESYTGPSWASLGGSKPLPVGYPFNLLPRVQTSFPVAYTLNEWHSLSDVRVEEGVFAGQERASWWLEGADIALPVDQGSSVQESPLELVCVLEKEGDTQEQHLALWDVSDQSNPLLWRRWKHTGQHASDPHTSLPFWCLQNLSFAEGHIALTQDTNTPLGGAGKGEVWLFSLRYDKVLVFEVGGMGTLVSFYDEGTGRILREKGSWGARRWITQDSFQPLTAYDGRYSKAFVGTYLHNTLEDIAPAITQGVCLRRGFDDAVYLAYGVQRNPLALPLQAKSFAGVIKLEDNAASYPRALARKDDGSYNVWDESGEAWVQVALTYSDLALYWTQAGEEGPRDQLEGVLCRALVPSMTFDNESTSPNNEVESWGNGSGDLFGGKGHSLTVQETATLGADIVFACTGWLAESFLSVLWRNPLDPSNSPLKTYGNTLNAQPYSYTYKEQTPSPFFPFWFNLRGDQEEDTLKAAQIAHSRAVGVDSWITTIEGFSTTHARFKGITDLEINQEVLRTKAIDRADFVLDADMRLVPPFAVGLGSALNAMNASQKWFLALLVRGEKDLLGSLTLRYVGNAGATGGVSVIAGLSYLTGGGVQQTAQAYLPTPNLLQNGVRARLRIKRTDATWRFLFFDEGANSFVEVMQVAGLRGPLVGGLYLRMTDGLGIEAGAIAEVSSFTLAPQDDPLGQEYVRPLLLRTVPTTHNVVNATGIREYPTTDTSGSFVVAEGFALPSVEKV